jgi:hypothetical protein
MDADRTGDAATDHADRATKEPASQSAVVLRESTEGKSGTESTDTEHPPSATRPDGTATAQAPKQPAGEKGGPKGPEPTRYGDWEKGGRCFDF